MKTSLFYLFLIMVTFTLGCGGGSGGGNTSIPTFPGVCANPYVTVSTGCTNAGTGDRVPTLDAIHLTSQYGRNADNQVKAADSMLSRTLGGLGGGRPITSAALAGTGGLGSTTITSAKPAIPTTLGYKKTGTGGNKEGSGFTPPSGGGKLDFSSLKTAPVSDDTGAGKANPALGTAFDASPSQVGAYGSGGNGAGGSGSGGDSARGGWGGGAQGSGFGSGFGSGGESGASASDLSSQSGDLSKDGSGALPTMLGDDPEDYFTRIGIEESIFKRVSKRYEKKATSWARAIP